MLGLGDVVIPGCFIALALRYDYHRYSKTTQKASFTKPYFYAALVSYIIGLVTTMTVMHIFKSAQPALLYLRYEKPSLMSFVLTNFLRLLRQSCLHPVIPHNGNGSWRTESCLGME
jgi:minor histocompatibility antigen H13